MQPIVIFILIAIGLLVYSYVTDIISPEKAITPQETGTPTGGTSQRQTAPSTAVPKTDQDLKLEVQKPTAPTISIDTFIKFGPRNNEVISDTNRLTFEFRAQTSPEKTEGQITFETKVEGLDNNWQETYLNERTIDFPAGVKEYTFQVRAKIRDKNIIDPTPAKLTFKMNLSPSFGKVKISNLRLPGFLIYSQITLNTYLGQNETINITGWKFQGKNGYFLIPQGIELYNPLVKTLESKDIVIKQGDTIYISSEANPLGGLNWNFRLNKCIGYLTHNFPIPIPKNCPRPQSEKIPRYLEKCCQDYILSLATCQQPTYQGMVSYGVLNDSQCFDYLNSTFNYTGCFANYWQESNFLENQWHIYLNRIDKEIMDQKLDTIYIWDKNGLLVDKYTYGSAPCCGQ